ncbi:arsenate reductase [Chitinophaga costaii]|nr:ArsC/Spx/MgsR family protein [Chitinophaga costaii]PUZ26875.1 arsenate reductase [Chitinophaga costaii]
MNKCYHLSTCSTCKKIIDAAGLPSKGFTLQNIKTEKITSEQLEEMHKLVGSYEALFSRKSQQYRSRGLHEKQLTEDDYKNLILEEYSFLKRPVTIVGNQIFIGNGKDAIAGLVEATA